MKENALVSTEGYKTSSRTDRTEFYLQIRCSQVCGTQVKSEGESMAILSKNYIKHRLATTESKPSN